MLRTAHDRFAMIVEDLPRQPRRHASATRPKKVGPGHAKGEDNIRAKLTISQVREFKLALKANPDMPIKPWSEKFGVGLSTLVGIRRGKNWAHVEV